MGLAVATPPDPIDHGRSNGKGSRMVALRHPLSGTLYERIGDPPCAVRVVGTDGVEGIFDDSARHLSGERRTADIAMCRWVANGLSAAERAARKAAANRAGTRGQPEGSP
jgi:hypothetical protein